MRWRRRKKNRKKKNSPSAFLFVHVEDERLLGEGELVLPLGTVIVQSFHCALRHIEAKKDSK